MTSGPPAVLLTGVGKRHDIVSAFSEHAFTIAADPNPLAPAQYAAGMRVAPPRIDDPAYIPFLLELVAEHSVGAVVPLTDLDIHVLAASDLPAFTPAPDVCEAMFDKYRCHELLTLHGLPSPPTVLPGSEPASYPVMVKPRQGSGARSIHPAHDREEMEFFVRYVKEPVMVQRLMGGHEFSIDVLCDLDGRCLNAIPRTMLESRGGESIKGQVIDDPELVELARSVVETLRFRGPSTVQVFRDPRDRHRDHRRQPALRRRVRGADVRRAAGPHVPRADRAHGRRRAHRAARRRVPKRPLLHALLRAARARRAAAADRPADARSLRRLSRVRAAARDRRRSA